MCILTNSEEEAQKLKEVLTPDDVPVEGLKYWSEVRGASLCYTFESEMVLRVRNAADEVLEHATLVEVIKGLGEPRRG